MMTRVLRKDMFRYTITYDYIEAGVRTAPIILPSRGTHCKTPESAERTMASVIDMLTRMHTGFRLLSSEVIEPKSAM
jgi:hypothetical protein